jgi:hypothetical protein
VVGRLGKFVAVQVKSTMTKLESGKGYNCNVCSCHRPYRAGAFDFLAAYVIPEDAWYLIPAKLIRGLKSISLCTSDGGKAKYEDHREAWHLLREASGDEESHVSQNRRDMRYPEIRESEESPSEARMGPDVARMQGAMNFFRNYSEKGGRESR